jgi:hypothetical protein
MITQQLLSTAGDGIILELNVSSYRLEQAKRDDLRKVKDSSKEAK